MVREILNLFAMEVPALAKEPVEYAETDYDLLELNIENTVDSVAGETTLPQTERPGQWPVVRTKVSYVARDGQRHQMEIEAVGRGSERFEAGKHRLIKLNLYHLFRQEFDFPEAPWGILHGVRPTKIVHRMLAEGLSRDEVVARLRQDYEASEEKATTIVDMAIRQQPFLARTDEKTISIYVGIPFCLTRCLYCSFPANILPDRGGIDKFMTAFQIGRASCRERV